MAARGGLVIQSPGPAAVPVVAFLISVVVNAAPRGTRQQNGMDVRQFQGVPNILEVTCSGDFLEPQAEVIMMSLYTADEELASVNAHRECFTHTGFSSCLIDRRHSKKTKLRTLVMDLPAGGAREYGCSMTVVKSGRDVEVISRTVLARRESKLLRSIERDRRVILPTKRSCGNGTCPWGPGSLEVVLAGL
ncbi:hypothetical protein BaRGS_00018453 [Batillaria attramentaria]|uniref:Uncharacterized protein n=1 Tax=Batillaria attramentaria TaxID=370345 RepID=A0ABD0KSU9_9CAEN